MKKPRVINVVGARPNFVKVAPLVQEMRLRGIEQVLVHTGQHYDENMSGKFFEDFDLQAQEYLGVGSGTHAEQTARIMLAFEPVLLKYRPDWLVVVGDVNSTLACTLVASKLDVRVCHVEAGLRSYDRSMPEEINRVVTDALSQLLCTPSRDATENLLKEGIAPDRIRFVGNIMIDTLYRLLPRAKNSTVVRDLELEERRFCVATIHRASNVDDRDVLARLLDALRTISTYCLCVLPLHPRTRTRIDNFGLDTSGLRVVEPLGYLDFICLVSKARLVITDSGGLQEETSVLGIPCLTVRDNTERPITIWEGTNQLVGTDTACIVAAARKVLDEALPRPAKIEKWDGRTAERVVDALLDFD
ncbi:MAG: UDP-N-acetylglucosamine 2-epimerase (non-hydrolyzing) [Acidobacteriota bacterium]|nr:UDP-N-acetylglucosamine 2-epimerase (non-hydrolyzing) [Blastocatellia bacterium]MDW8413579.1 UDP-N-acetylglucosamine 2-epimerase (non-hydrolyzing) [Acidobacteriota bacterium]